jgi:aflatoxin B1 aldehyde reductase
MLLGANNARQLKEVLEEVEKGPLEKWVVGRLDELWEMVRDDAPIDNLKAVADAIRRLRK